MILKKRPGKFFLIMMLIIFAIAVAGISVPMVGTRNRSAKSGKEIATIELFLLAPCENCREDDKFRQEIAGQLTRAGYENQEFKVYNVYKEVSYDLIYLNEDEDILLWLGRDNEIDCDWENGRFYEGFSGTWGELSDGNYLLRFEFRDALNRELYSEFLEIEMKDEEFTYLSL